MVAIKVMVAILYFRGENLKKCTACGFVQYCDRVCQVCNTGLLNKNFQRKIVNIVNIFLPIFFSICFR